MDRAYSIPVLMYHHVRPGSGMIAVSPERFEAQIAALARGGWRSLTTQDLERHLAGEPVPPKSVLITFDDGYLDNWVYAHPVLQRHGMSAVLFLVTSWIGDGPVRPYAGQVIGQGAAQDAVPACPDPVPACPDHNESKRLLAEGRGDEVALRWSEVQAMRAAGTFEFHSHTHTHTRWDKRYPDDVAAKRQGLAADLAASIDTLKVRFGSVSDQLCWPQGYFDPDYIDIAREAGFRVLHTTDALGQNVAGGDPTHIYRFAVPDRKPSWLLRRAWFAASPFWGPKYHAWRAWKRSLRKRK